MTKFIIHFEPEDVEADTREEAKIKYQLSFKRPTVSRILVSRGIDHDTETDG